MDKEILDTLDEVLKVWLHQYAGEFCDETMVEESQRKIDAAGGTLGYITEQFGKVDQWGNKCTQS